MAAIGLVTHNVQQDLLQLIKMVHICFNHYVFWASPVCLQKITPFQTTHNQM